MLAGLHVCRDVEHFPFSAHACRSKDKGTWNENSASLALHLLLILQAVHMTFTTHRVESAWLLQQVVVILSLFGSLLLTRYGLHIDEATFDMEYARWLEEHHRLMCELRRAVQEQSPENELRMLVDICLAHYDQMMHLKGAVIKSDVFHLISGMWMTPAERCFMWMGGFRPSELIKMARC
ncbi:hypothetical protein GW17_00016468, partial [Ensete ventricosum]